MKIDKRRPTHWLYLVLFLLQGALGLGLRRLFKTTAIRDCKAVILYGHKLNGNLLALYRAKEADYRHQLRPVFVTMDPAYHRTLKAAGIRSQWACGIDRSEEHTSELQSLMRISYAVFCLKTKK